MAKLTVDGATLACSKGSSPARLTVLPATTTLACELAAATVQDMLPIVNIGAFGMCSAPSNPQVAAATAATMGTLTPQPCVPATAGRWTPGSRIVSIGNQAALSDSCRCACQWGGAIQVQDAGQTDVEVD